VARALLHYGGMRILIAVLVGLAACSDSDVGVPFDGDASGQYGDDSFDPRFAVAFARDDGRFEIQFGENALSCGDRLHNGSGNPTGLFVRLILDPTKFAVGENTSVWIEYDSLTSSGTSQTFSTDAKVTFDSIDEVQVVGSVTHTRVDEKRGTLSFNGTFAVTRCD
jgi:hypothetical protein